MTPRQGQEPGVSGERQQPLRCAAGHPGSSATTRARALGCSSTRASTPHLARRVLVTLALALEGGALVPVGVSEFHAALLRPLVFVTVPPLLLALTATLAPAAALSGTRRFSAGFDPVSFDLPPPGTGPDSASPVI